MESSTYCSCVHMIPDNVLSNFVQYNHLKNNKGHAGNLEKKLEKVGKKPRILQTEKTGNTVVGNEQNKILSLCEDVLVQSSIP